MAPKAEAGRIWALACALVVLAGVGVRVFIHTRSPITPAIDGAYYAIQPRALLAGGKLDSPDMPVKFAVDAALARAMQASLGLSLDDACMRASQVTDCLLPPCIAVPLFLLAARVSRSRTALVTATAAAAMLVVGGPALRMVADFQKNALALVFMAAMLQQCCATLEAWQRQAQVRWRPVAATGAWLATTTLTHAGTGAVAGLNLALVVAAAMPWFPALRRKALGRAGVIAILCLVVLVGLAWSLLHWLDPARATRILEAPLRALNPSEGGTLHQPGAPGMRAHGMPFAAVIVVGAACGWTLLRRASTAATWSRVAGVACMLTAASITLPVLDGDSANRLALVAIVPGAVAFTLAFAAGPAGTRGVWPAGVVLLAALASAPGGVRFASRPCIDPASLEELRTLRELVPEHRRALLVARHGLEFWANWAIDVNTRQSGIPSDAFERYDRVLVLTEARPFDPIGGDAPSRRPGLAHGDARPRVGRMPDDEGGQPEDGPPRFGPPPGRGGFGPPAGRGGFHAPRGVRPPPGSRLVFEGRHFRLFEVPRTPAENDMRDDADLP